MSVMNFCEQLAPEVMEKLFFFEVLYFCVSGYTFLYFCVFLLRPFVSGAFGTVFPPEVLFRL